MLATRGERLDPVELDDEARDQLAAGRATPLAEALHAAGSDDTARRVVAALQGILARTWLVPTWDAAVLLHGRHPGLTFVTPEGDLAGPYGYRGGQSPTASAVVTATAADEAEVRARGRVALDELAEQAARPPVCWLAPSSAWPWPPTDHESDAAITGAAERLARLNKELVALSNQREVVAAQQSELTDLLARDREALSDSTPVGRCRPTNPSPRTVPTSRPTPRRGRRGRPRARARHPGHARRTTEQVRHLERQAADLRREADEVEVALAEAARRREARRAGIARCGTLAAVCATALEHLSSSIDAAAEERDALQATARARRRRSASLARGCRRRKASWPRFARSATRPTLSVPTWTTTSNSSPSDSPASSDCRPPTCRPSTPTPRVRAPRAGRGGGRAGPQAGLLGRVNPLALEEFKALEERHTFLSDQLEDLRQSKRDLEEVVVAVDDRIREVFAEAYDDIAREFQDIFTVMFPGGFGRLPSPTPTTCDHRHRGRGTATRQEGHAPVAAVRRRALADRAGVRVRDLPSAPARSTSWTRSTRRWTT